MNFLFYTNFTHVFFFPKKPYLVIIHGLLTFVYNYNSHNLTCHATNNKT